MTGMYMSHPVFAEKPFLSGLCERRKMAKALYKEGQRISGFAFEDAAQPRAERRDGLRGRPKMGTQGWGPGLGEAPYLVTPCPARPAPFASFASRSRVLKDALLHMLAVHFTVCPAVMAPRLVPRERLV